MAVRQWEWVPPPPTKCPVLTAGGLGDFLCSSVLAAARYSTAGLNRCGYEYRGLCGSGSSRLGGDLKGTMGGSCVPSSLTVSQTLCLPLRRCASQPRDVSLGLIGRSSLTADHVIPTRAYASTTSLGLRLRKCGSYTVYALGRRRVCIGRSARGAVSPDQPENEG